MGPDRISWVVVLHLLLSHIVMLCNPLHGLGKLHLKTRQYFASRIPAGKPLHSIIPPAVINYAISHLNIFRDGLEAFAQWPTLSSSLNNSFAFLVVMLEKKKNSGLRRVVISPCSAPGCREMCGPSGCEAEG